MEEKTKGQLFKEKYGYSKSMKRNMQKHELEPSEWSLNEYRGIRKKRKKQETEKRKDKHSLAKANRRAPKAKTTQNKK